MDWNVSHTDSETDLDTVDIRIIRQSNSLVGDSAIYAYDTEVTGTLSVGDVTRLIDKGGCDSTYVTRIFAETTGGATALESTNEFTVS